MRKVLEWSCLSLGRGNRDTGKDRVENCRNRQTSESEAGFHVSLSPSRCQDPEDEVQGRSDQLGAFTGSLLLISS